MTKRGWAVVAVVIVVMSLAVAAIVHSRDVDESKAESTSTETTTTDSVTPSTESAPEVTTSTITATTVTTVNPALNPARGSDAGPVTLRTPQRCTSTETPTGSLPGADQNGAKQWVTVAHLSGSCDLSSQQFRLKAIDTRIAWRSDATSFNAFVLDSKTGLDATAGYPDADCQGACSESQALVLEAGTYVLRVQADSGPWEINVQEYR